MNKEQQRKEFEEWALDKGYFMRRSKYENTSYMSFPTDAVWQAWQAAQKDLTEQRDRLAEAMRQMWPFIEEDDYPNCNMPAFNAAILKYKEALQSLTTNEL
jgi:hypothetical protein